MEHALLETAYILWSYGYGKHHEGTSLLERCSRRYVKPYQISEAYGLFKLNAYTSLDTQRQVMRDCLSIIKPKKEKENKISHHFILGNAARKCTLSPVQTCTDSKRLQR